MASPSPTSASTTKEVAASQTEAAPPATAVPVKTFEVPFDGLGVEFVDDLECVSIALGDGKTRKKLVARKPDGKPYLPGQPRIHLEQPQHGAPRGDHIRDYLTHCHSTRDLDELLPFMRYVFVQTPSYTHITPLHHQKSRAREIKVTESPGLHLVWFYEMIFIKPIPAYFFSKAFWEYLENVDLELRKACLGFMRSYYMLIQFEIDFREACKLNLIPPKNKKGKKLTYEEWCEFIKPFAKVGDNHINRRYHYGELRLSRINRAAFFRRGRLAYFHIYPQWGSFLEHTLTPIITIFAVCSVVLNSMQVGLAAIVVEPGTVSGAWPKFVAASLWFPVLVMVAIAIVLAVALIGMGAMGVEDLIRGNYVRRRKKRGDDLAGTRSHGMVW
ncbi:hypothetical protein C8A05DRAFT_17644 [Staphylotrichum tortipilum]|uniref:Uncharacterized protein n=1 Tax=Staphylotrichum tortipilum TaxID=2831512 RepID=A0AAN6MH02_9PEZI|nr:hypothetical protein C8A05DRAFT_17644 [Staphylotrichum longicolle]